VMHGFPLLQWLQVVCLSAGHVKRG
jgi:hypothetical protein